MAAKRTRRDRLDLALETPLVDYIGAVGLTCALVGLAHWHAGFDALGHLSAAQRTDLYGRLIGPLSIVASLATAGLAVYASATGPGITLLRATYGGRVLKQFRGAATAAGLVVVTLVVVFVAQTGYSLDWTRWVALGAVLFVVLRAARVTYYYSNVLKIIDEDKTPTAPRRSLDDPPARPTATGSPRRSLD